MIRRITLKNYMSHVHTIIEPADGLTVLVGPNNCGKSAVVSALETLCNNASGDYMVRHDEREASVTVETDEDHVLVWKRRGKTVSYSIDGHEIDRVNRKFPEELHKLLRLPKVNGGKTGDSFDIHFGTQKSPIFLLNESESRAARFFASSSDALILLKMQELHRSKVRDRKSDEKRLKSEIENLDAELIALEPLDALATSLKKAEEQYQGLEELECQIRKFEEEIERLRAHAQKHELLEQEYQCLAPLKLPPDLADTSPLKSLMADLSGAEYQHQLSETRCRALADLDPPPAFADVQKLESVYWALSQAEENHRILSATAVHLGRLNGPPDLEDIYPLENLITHLTMAEYQLQVTKARFFALESLDPPPAFDDVQKLESVCRALYQAEENHRILSAAAVRLGRLNDPPVLDAPGSLERMVADLESAQRANVAFNRQQGALESLTTPPVLTDPKPLAELIRQLDDAFRDDARHEGLVKTTAANMDKLEADLYVAERGGTGSLLPGSVARRPQRRMALATSVLVCMILLILGLTWFNRINTGSTDGARKVVDPAPKALAKSAESRGRIGNVTGAANEANKLIDPTPKAAAKADDKARIGKAIESSDGANKSVDPPSKAVAKNNDNAKTGVVAGPPAAVHKSIDSTPKEVSKAVSDGEKRNLPASQRAAETAKKHQRLKEVRRLLKDAEMAHESGKYLDAVLGFGQAAILYPQELAEVESPEKVKRNFMDALKGYQTEVELALEKAAKQKGGDRQSEP